MLYSINGMGSVIPENSVEKPELVMTEEVERKIIR